LQFLVVVQFCVNFFDQLIIIGRLCIEVTSASKIAYISEELCIGCGICVKVLKFDDIYDVFYAVYLFIYLCF
jgi:translation initiation factor RLI1